MKKRDTQTKIIYTQSSSVIEKSIEEMIREIYQVICKAPLKPYKDVKLLEKETQQQKNEHMQKMILKDIIKHNIRKINRKDKIAHKIAQTTISKNQ